MVVAEGVFLILTSYNVLNNNLPPPLLNQEYMALETIELAHLFSKWKKKSKDAQIQAESILSWKSANQELRLLLQLLQENDFSSESPGD